MSKTDNWLHCHQLSWASIIIEAVLDDDISQASISSGLGRGEQNSIMSRGVHLSASSQLERVVTGRGGSRPEACSFVRNAREICVVGWFFSHVFWIVTGSATAYGRGNGNGAFAKAEALKATPAVRVKELYSSADVTHCPSSPRYLLYHRLLVDCFQVVVLRRRGLMDGPLESGG